MSGIHQWQRSNRKRPQARKDDARMFWRSMASFSMGRYESNIVALCHLHDHRHIPPHATRNPALNLMTWQDEGGVVFMCQPKVRRPWMKPKYRKACPGRAVWKEHYE